MRRWVDDLVLGIRLAVGGSRNSWARLLLTAVGIGLGVAVLLLAASLPTAIQDKSARRTERALPTSSQQLSVPGRDAVLATNASTRYRGESVGGVLLQPLGPSAPVPKGLTEIPRLGTWAVSPALDALLDSPDGELLRPRFPGPRTVIADEGLTGPRELYFYGRATGLEQASQVYRVYEFGTRPSVSPYVSPLLLLVLIALATLLIPVVVFIATSSRLAAAARDRRLAAIRLVGADSVQARRIAAGETLLGSVLGLVVGTVVFLTGKQLIELFELDGVSVFAADVRPVWWLAALVAVGVPALAVGVSILTLRTTLVDPLGSVRSRPPVRRRLGWRLVPLVLGLAALASQANAFALGERLPSGFSKLVVVGGVSLLLISIPVLLPWLIEKVAGLLTGGRVSWQLAMRRLQLDSGNAGRIIAGLAVVLAGGIALQTMLLAAGRDYPVRMADTDVNTLRVYVSSGAGDPGELADRLRAVPGLREAESYYAGGVRGQAPQSYLAVTTGSCEELARLALVPGCAPGRTYRLPDHDGESTTPKAGEKVAFTTGGDSWEHDWVLPRDSRPAAPLPGSGKGSQTGLLVAPGVLPAEVLHRMSYHALIRLDPGQPDAGEHVRNALGPLGWRASVTFADYRPEDEGDTQAQNYATIKRAVFGGVLVALGLAAASLLVIGFEQVRERRRPLAVLAANGVPRRTLAASLLWQQALPVGLAVLVAAVTGVVMSVLLLWVLDTDIALDWDAVGLSSGAALVAAFAVALLTLPSVLRAMRPEGLRAE
ncbi:hypothetical protein JOF53_004822 [Crossiella equi]|uniref:ABC3 transporter permease C-terminal domain-containing protein n=1 Tax=Crossiella equi TaxID=130796 RepID=A0ABS5AH96_9PSEU|nr:FtsX-like permease family protein [Crossiella equi]MBP2475950.1 hypothetical protein [Crossiella equi]